MNKKASQAPMPGQGHKFRRGWATGVATSLLLAAALWGLTPYKFTIISPEAVAAAKRTEELIGELRSQRTSLEREKEDLVSAHKEALTAQKESITAQMRKKMAVQEADLTAQKQRELDAQKEALTADMEAKIESLQQTLSESKRDSSTKLEEADTKIEELQQARDAVARSRDIVTTERDTLRSRLGHFDGIVGALHAAIPTLAKTPTRGWALYGEPCPNKGGSNHPVMHNRNFGPDRLPKAGDKVTVKEFTLVWSAAPERSALDVHSFVVTSYAEWYPPEKTIGVLAPGQEVLIKKVMDIEWAFTYVEFELVKK